MQGSLLWRGACFQRQQTGIFGELVGEFRCAAQECAMQQISPVTGHVAWLGLAQVLSTTLTRAQFMLVVVVDFLEDGGLSRCVVFCWWWI